MKAGDMDLRRADVEREGRSMTAGNKPYPAMKDSGVPWLWRVPEHWEVKRGKWLFYSTKELNLRNSNVNVLSLTLRGVVNNDPDHPEGLVPKVYSSYQFFAKDDLVFKLIDLENLRTSRVGIVHEDGIMSPAYVRVIKSHNGFQQYFFRQYYDLYQRGIYNQLGAGVRSTLGAKELLEIPILNPPCAEQYAVVRFLDFVDRWIRRYIRAKQKLIKLLEEQKQAIIHRAVTRGLDPNVRLKPSGVPWIGDVPEHWEVVRLKTLVSSVTSGSRGWSNFEADYGVLFIRIGNLTRSSINLNLEKPVRLRLPNHVLGEAKRTRVRKNDILLSITAFIGSVAVVPTNIEEAYVSQHVACCRPRSIGVNPKWIAYVLLSPIGQIYGQLRMYGGTKQGLSLDDVKNYLILKPTLFEQEELVKWIETNLAPLDVQKNNIKHEIQLIREYRTRLIADVVTGKLDVREAAARLPDEAEEIGSPEETTEDEVEEEESEELDEAPEEAEA